MASPNIQSGYFAYQEQQNNEFNAHHLNNAPSNYPMGNIQPMNVENDRNLYNQGFVLSENMKYCLIFTSIASFLIFIIMLLF